MPFKISLSAFFTDWLGESIYSINLEKQYLEQFNRFVEVNFETKNNESIHPTIYYLTVFQGYIDAWASSQLNQCRENNIKDFNTFFISLPKSRDSFTGLHFGFMSEKININNASVEELRQIPGIGNSSARKIEETRNLYGLFNEIEDLLSKKCLSEEAYQLCKHYISHTDKSIGTSMFNCVHTNFSTFVLLSYALHSNKGIKNIQEFALNEMSKAVNYYLESPFNPYTSSELPLSNNSLEEGMLQCLDLEHKKEQLQTAILNSTNYLKLLIRIIPRAKKSIYIQAPSLNLLYLPTLKYLLDLLVESRKVNIDIRILYDGNYSPSAIESDDIAYLIAQNVPCKAITIENRVHSRVIVIDNEHVICGSQSWSATSFYHSQECSLYIKSKDLANRQTKRFRQLWKKAQ